MPSVLSESDSRLMLDTELLTGYRAVRPKRAGWRKLSQPMTNHVLGDKHLYECSTVVDLEGVPNEIRHDH